MNKVTDCSEISTDSEDSTTNLPRHEHIPPDALNKLKSSYLKEKLKKRGQWTVGINKVLLEILELSMNKKVTLAATTANKNLVMNNMNSFEINLYWKV